MRTLLAVEAVNIVSGQEQVGSNTLSVLGRGFGENNAFSDSAA
jgi:hypothetical protein